MVVLIVAIAVERRADRGHDSIPVAFMQPGDEGIDRMAQSPLIEPQQLTPLGVVADRVGL